MRCNIQEPANLYRNFLCRQNQQYGMGVDIPPFMGARFQKGYGIGNFLGGLFRSVIPLAKSVFKVARPVLKRTGKQVLKRGIKSGVKVIEKVAQGQNLKKVLKTEGQKALLDLQNKALSEISQLSSAKSIHKKRKSSQKRYSKKRVKRDILD